MPLLPKSEDLIKLISTRVGNGYIGTTLKRIVTTIDTLIQENVGSGGGGGGGLSLGETPTTAYAGNKGKQALDNSNNALSQINTLKGGSTETIAALKAALTTVQNSNSSNTQAISDLMTLLNSDNSALDTIQEIVDYIENNKTTLDSVLVNKLNKSVYDSFIISNNQALANKVDKDGAKVLSDVNYTTAKDTKLNGVQTGAQVNSVDISTFTTGTLNDDRLSTKVVKKGSDELIPIADLPEANLVDLVDSGDFEFSTNGKQRIRRDTLITIIQNQIAMSGGNTTPDAPTAFVTNDTDKTADWTNTAGFANIADYEKTLDGGTNYTAAGSKPFTVIGEKAAGQVGIRVKAATGRNASPTLYNTVAFTAGEASEDLLAGFEYITEADLAQFSGDAYEFSANGLVTYTNGSGDLRLRFNKTFKNGSQIAFRYKGEENSMMGSRHDADQYGIEQGLALSASDNVIFFINAVGNDYPASATAAILNNWYRGTFSESTGYFTWETSTNGTVWTAVDTPTDRRTTAVGDFFVLQFFADGEYKKLHAVQYKGLDTV